MTQLICRELSLGYEGKTVCEGVNLSVCEGDYLCIVGENGSGKTTLMKAILKLCPKQSGDIEFREGYSRNDVGYLPQRSELQRDFPASVQEVVTSGLTAKAGARPFFDTKMKLLAAQKMKDMGIWDIRKSPFSSLSGGQAQRVLLARALLSAGKILLLDEPTSGLDPEATEDFYSLLCRLNKEEKMTVIMITHDVVAARKYANKVLHMGKTPEFFDSVQDYINSEYFSHSAQGGEKV